MGFGFHSGPFQFHVLAYNQLQGDVLKGALQRRQVDLAVSLAAMRVARPYEPAFEKDGDEDRWSFLKLVDVHVRAVLPGAKSRDRRHRIFNSAFARRRVLGIDADRKCAREWLEIDGDSGFELGLTVFPIKVEVLDEPLWKFRWQRADCCELFARKIEIEAKPFGSDLQNADLHHIAGFGPIDIDRTS